MKKSSRRPVRANNKKTISRKKKCKGSTDHTSDGALQRLESECRQLRQDFVLEKERNRILEKSIKQLNEKSENFRRKSEKDSSCIAKLKNDIVQYLENIQNLRRHKKKRGRVEFAAQ